MALDGESDILTIIYSNNCKEETVLFYVGISNKFKKYYKINYKILQNKINQQLIFLKTAKNCPLFEVRFTKPEASRRTFFDWDEKEGSE